MGALDTLNGTGAALALDNNGDIPETAIPATVARDTEINDGTLTFSGGATGTFTANQAGDTTIAIPAATTPADATITIAAGTNLTGGGSFTTNQANNATITLNASGGGVSIPGHGAVGAYGLMRNETNGTPWTAGQARSGTGIRLTGLDSNGTSLYGDVVSGTWRNMSAGLQGSRQTTVGLRIS